MTQEIDKHTKAIADSSGFPLQLRIRELVATHGDWQVKLEEHPWKVLDTYSYIDLVINKRRYTNQILVIECKRANNAQWVFLTPSSTSQSRHPDRIWYSVFRGDSWLSYDWRDAYLEPFSALSSYCAIKGQEQGRNVLLERTTSLLVESIEALAQQEKDRFESNVDGDRDSGTFNRIYTPVIVTTAVLRLAIFDAEKISLHDGALPDDTKYETVPYLRYRKSMGEINIFQGYNIRDANINSEKTVFIVNAEHFDVFLNEWNIFRST